MRQLTKRQKQSIATKLKITQVSMELFKSNGFENVKIQDICDKAEISIGAFYHHFESKAEIINKGYEQVDLLVEESLSSKTFSTNIEKILGLLTEGCEILKDLGWIFVSDVYKNLLYVDGKYSLSPERYVTLEIKNAIESGIKTGELKKDICSYKLTETLLRVSRGVIFDWCLNQGQTDLKANMLFDINLVLNNYKC